MALWTCVLQAMYNRCVYNQVLIWHWRETWKLSSKSKCCCAQREASCPAVREKRRSTYCGEKRRRRRTGEGDRRVCYSILRAGGRDGLRLCGWRTDSPACPAPMPSPAAAPHHTPHATLSLMSDSKSAQCSPACRIRMRCGGGGGGPECTSCKFSVISLFLLLPFSFGGC